jgi:hypothetical protein
VLPGQGSIPAYTALPPPVRYQFRYQFSATRGRRHDPPLDKRIERWLALLFGFLSGLLTGAAVGHTVGAGWWL